MVGQCVRTFRVDGPRLVWYKPGMTDEVVSLLQAALKLCHWRPSKDLLKSDSGLRQTVLEMQGAIGGGTLPVVRAIDELGEWRYDNDETRVFWPEVAEWDWAGRPSGRPKSGQDAAAKSRYLASPPLVEREDDDLAPSQESAFGDQTAKAGHGGCTQVDEASHSFDYSTPYLEILFEAVEKFWVGFDPGRPDDRSSQEEILGWLTRTKGCSQRVAEAIDLLIRPPEASQLGRRKKG